MDVSFTEDRATPRPANPLRVPRVSALVIGLFLILPVCARSQSSQPSERDRQDLSSLQTTEPHSALAPRLEGTSEQPNPEAATHEYRLGIDDVVEINVFDAPELNRKLRVSGTGDISVPLVGTVRAGGLTAGELEAGLEVRLREFMKEPHVGVFVTAVESHPISVLGAVKKPGVFQVRGPKTILEMLSMAEGLSEDAGDVVLVMRGASSRSANVHQISNDRSDGNAQSGNVTAASHSATASDATDADAGDQTARINLANLLRSEDPRLNLPVYPGDIVKVVKAGVVYVVGEVKKPGGFVLKSDERMSVLKAIALAEGLTPTSAKSGARIIRADAGGAQHEEIPINLGKILAGKAPDPTLTATDIVFVPNSTGKAAAYKGSEAAISAITSLLIFKW